MPEGAQVARRRGPQELCRHRRGSVTMLVSGQEDGSHRQDVSPALSRASAPDSAGGPEVATQASGRLHPWGLRRQQPKDAHHHFCFSGGGFTKWLPSERALEEVVGAAGSP